MMYKGIFKVTLKSIYPSEKPIIIEQKAEGQTRGEMFFNAYQEIVKWHSSQRYYITKLEIAKETKQK